jgi:hypothetical protein
MTFDLKDALQVEDDFFPEDPDHEEYEGYMGNSGPEATHWYKTFVGLHHRSSTIPSLLTTRQAVVIVPTDYLVEYLNGSNLYGEENTIHLESLTIYFREKCVDLAKTDLQGARYLCDEFYHGIIVAHSGLAPVRAEANPKTVEMLLCTTLELEDRELWKELVSSVAGAQGGIKLSFFAWLRRQILTGDLTWEVMEEG